MTAGTREQAVTGRPLKAGLVLASGASGAASRQSWDPGVHAAQAIRFPAPTGISLLWHSGGSSVPRHAAPKAGTRVVRPGNPSGQTSFRLPATHLTPHPGEIRAPCLLPDGRPGRTDPHGGGGAWGERLKFKGRPGVPAGLCCHAPRGPTGAGTVSPCGQAAGRGRGAVPLRASASSSVPGCDPALRETSPAPTCEGACETGGESASWTGLRGGDSCLPILPLCRVERLQTFEGEASPSPSRLLSFTLIPPAFTEKTFRAFFPTWGGRGQGTLEAASSAAQTCRRA